MRERASRLFHVDDRHNTSEIFSSFEELVALTRSSAEDYDMVVRIIRALIPLFQCQIERYGSRSHRSVFNDSLEEPVYLPSSQLSLNRPVPSTTCAATLFTYASQLTPN